MRTDSALITLGPASPYPRTRKYATSGTVAGQEAAGPVRSFAIKLARPLPERRYRSRGAQEHPIEDLAWALPTQGRTT